MKELEFKHLAGYLPYGILAKLSKKGIFNQDNEYPNPRTKEIGIIKNISFWHPEITGQLHVSETYSFDFDEIDEIDFIFHPLSDLTKPIEVNGETFVPIIELAKLFFESKAEYKVTHYENPRYNHSYLVNCCYENDSNRYAYFSIKNDIFKNSFEIAQKLQEWHFWIYDQSAFENGLIIDINTLKK